MSTRNKEIVHDEGYELQWRMFGDGSRLESQIGRALQVADDKKGLFDWIRPRQWRKERAEWETYAASFISFVEAGDEGARASGRNAMQAHPEHFMVYILQQIHAIENDHRSGYIEWRDRNRRLQELNVGNQTGRHDLSHAIINDMIVYLQEKWVGKMAPDALKLGGELVAEKVPLPEKLRFNSAFVTKLFTDWLDKEGIIKNKVWESGAGHIYASVKSDSSVIKESLLRREDLWGELEKQASELGVESVKQPDKMLDAWEKMRLFSEVISRGTPEQKSYWTNIIKEQVGKMEHLLRCRAYFDDPDAFNQVMQKGLNVLGTYPVELRTQFKGQIGAKAFMAVDTPSSYYRSGTQARDGGNNASGMAVDGKEVSFANGSAFWLSALSQSPARDETSAIRLNYLHYPIQINRIGNGWTLDRLTPKDVTTKQWVGGSIEMEMSWWEGLVDSHRPIWDRRARGLDLERDWMPVLRKLWRLSRNVESKWWPQMQVIPWEKVLEQLELVERSELQSQLNQ